MTAAKLQQTQASCVIVQDMYQPESSGPKKDYINLAATSPIQPVVRTIYTTEDDFPR